MRGRHAFHSLRGMVICPFYVVIFVIYSFSYFQYIIKFGEELLRQIVGTPMGTNCAPLLANLYLFSYEYDFTMNLLKKKQLHLARKFNFSYRYIDDLISFNNPEFKKYYKKIYPKELELKETTENNFGCSYLDIYFFRNYRNMIKSKLYDKRDDFNFHFLIFRQ